MASGKMNKYDRRHLNNLTAIQRQVDRVFDTACKEAARLGVKIGETSPDRLFSFSDYPITRKEVESLLDGLKTRLSAVVVNGVRSEWSLSNNKNDELCRQVFGDNIGRLSQAQYRRYFSTNGNALDAFLKRKESGLNLSDRVWRYTEAFKSEIELGLDVGIRNGLSAAEMTRELKQWLQRPDTLFRRVRDEHGDLQLSKAAAAFHPGQGVYRSSYKNARRLAATESNIAYRTADYERWQELDFVVGIEICLSNNHTLLGSDGVPHPFTDICDELAGRYPKDFKFTGWHPHCRCHAVSILKTPEEMAEDNRRIMAGEDISETSENTVNELPNNFTSWAEENEERTEKASVMPYFIRDNQGMMSGTYLDRAISDTQAKARLTGEEVQGLAESIAKKYGAVCTPINFKGANSIRRKVETERNDYPTFSPDKLKDAVRTTIISEREQMQNIISSLKEAEGFVRWKPQRTPLGYTGNIINVRTARGLIAEIQVNTARMIYAKESPVTAKAVIGVDMWNKIHAQTGLEGGLGHKFYEAWRVLDPNSKEAKAIMKKSVAYYRHFTS